VQHLGGSIQDAYAKLIAFYQALSPEQRVELGIVDQEQLDNVIAKLGQAAEQTQEWGKVAGVSSKDIAQSFASTAASAFTNFINKVAAGKNVFKSLGDGVREFAAGFISAIAQMIIQLLAFEAVVLIMKALGVPIPASFSAGSHHTGGIVGQGTGQRRQFDPAVFAGAARFHNGGVVGLAPDEQAIIAKKGEEVLTENDPRHRNNGGGSTRAAAPSGNVTLINLSDPAEVLEHALRAPAGERVLINHVRNNAGAFKAALG
jgi:hypothetical protein